LQYQLVPLHRGEKAAFTARVVLSNEAASPLPDLGPDDPDSPGAGGRAYARLLLTSTEPCSSLKSPDITYQNCSHQAENWTGASQCRPGAYILHSSTSQLNVNTLCGIHWVVSVACSKIDGSQLVTNWSQNDSLTKTAQVELGGPWLAAAGARSRGSRVNRPTWRRWLRVRLTRREPCRLGQGQGPSWRGTRVAAAGAYTRSLISST